MVITKYYHISIRMYNFITKLMSAIFKDQAEGVFMVKPNISWWYQTFGFSEKTFLYGTGFIWWRVVSRGQCRGCSVWSSSSAEEAALLLLSAHWWRVLCCVCPSWRERARRRETKSILHSRGNYTGILLSVKFTSDSCLSRRYGW